VCDCKESDLLSINQPKLQKIEVISVIQLHYKAPEKSHATEELFGYSSEYTVSQPYSGPRVSYNVISVLACNKPKGVKPKMRWSKLRIDVNCQTAMKQTGISQVSVKQGLPAFF